MTPAEFLASPDYHRNFPPIIDNSAEFVQIDFSDSSERDVCRHETDDISWKTEIVRNLKKP
jgi:hypothetical protein